MQLKNLMCQRLGTSPLFFAGLLQLGFLKCDISLIVVVARSEGEECLFLSLVFNPWCCPGSKGESAGKAPCSSWSRGERPGAGLPACH